MLVGFLIDQLDTSPKQIEISWGRFVEHFLANPEESPCALAEVASSPDQVCIGAKCPHKSHSSVPRKPMAFVPAIIEGSRLDKNVRALSLLVLDFDHLTAAEATQVEQALRAAQVEHVIYTTHNHRNSDIAFRVVVLLSRMVGADQWHRFLPSAIVFLGVSITQVDADGKVHQQPDPVCKNRSRLYYFSSHPQGAPSEAALFAGKPLDVDRILEWSVGEGAALVNIPDVSGEAFSDKAPLPTDFLAWDTEDVHEVIRAAARAFPTRRRNEFCLALAGMLRRAGADEDTAYRIVYEVARAGGSGEPDKRAKTVEHTYRADDDASLTGYTRLADIIGETPARAIGDTIVDARNEAFLRDFAPGGGPPEIEPASDGAAHDDGGGEPPPLLVNGHSGSPTSALPELRPAFPVANPAAVVDLGEIRRLISGLANSRGRSLDRDERIAAVLIRRALAGEPLAKPNDVETVRAKATGGVTPEEAVRSVVWSVAIAVPLDTPFEAVFEILRASFLATPEAPDKDGWAETARTIYRRAMRTRRVRDTMAALEESKFRAAVLGVGGGAGAGGGALPPLPPPALPPPLPFDPPQLPTSPAEGIAPPPPPPPEDPSGDPNAWKDALRKRGDGSLAPIPHNARVILEHDPIFRGALAWNDVTKKVEIRRTTGPLARYSGRLPIETVVPGIQDLLASGWDLPIPYQDLGRRVVSIARANSFDPLADYLRSVRWDGTPRIGNWLAKYCGAEDTQYVREVGRRWLLALIARGLKPGTKVDTILVFEAPQGIGKSTAFEILGGEWYCDTAIVLGDKDSQMLAGLYWICELAELVSFKKTGHDALKNFLSRRIDKFRPPYGHGYEEFPRRCLFVGTTNEAEYLTDVTGNRRYHCVACNYTDDATAALRRDRDQLIAEAVALYFAASSCETCKSAQERCPTHRWWFAYREIFITESESEKRVKETPARLRVESWWYGMTPSQRPEGFTTLDVVDLAFEGTTSPRVDDGLLAAIGHALTNMGFNRRRDGSGPRAYRHYPSEALRSAPQHVSVARTSSRGSLFALPSAAPAAAAGNGVRR